MKFQLEPVNHDKISDLCGPTNSILKQIEDELDIKILNRGPSFKINGESLNAQIAKDIILRIYDDLDENKIISSKEVHLYLRKGMNDLNNIKKNDIIYWKGHVAIALSNKKLIHAYGPMKKTVIMDINQTIKRIEQTANLKVIGIKRL